MSVSPPSATFHKSWSLFLRFLLPSMVGVGFFLVPFSWDKEQAIAVAHLASRIRLYSPLPVWWMSVGLLLFTSVMTAAGTLLRPAWLEARPWLARLWVTSPGQLGVRLLAGGMALLIVSGQAPGWLGGSETGEEVVYGLLPRLLVNLVLASFLSPLLLQYGLLEYVGTLAAPLMRRLFQLPGYAAVNCVASWLGDGTMGSVMAIREYEEGRYTEKEACIVITSFAAVSVTFYAAILSELALQPFFLPFCFITLSSSLVAGVILPYLPPLRGKRDQYKTGSRPAYAASPGADEPWWSRSLTAAMYRASQAPSAGIVLREGAAGAAEIAMSVLPGVMVVATLSLAVAMHTPFFAWLGAPFVPVLEWMGVKEAAAAAQGLLAGFTDMFIPTLIAKQQVTAPATRFILAALSVTQIVFLSELGALLLGNEKLRISLPELLIVFLLRTMLTLPLIVLFSQWWLP